jgi:curli biogenesis system outer membrane secretion channel CsgG
MRAILRLSVLSLAFAGLAMTTSHAQGTRPTVALLDFDFGSVDNWWGNQDIGKGIADLVVDALVDDGSFRVIERKRLDAILAEQNFSNSDRADPNAKTVSQLQKALGVKYLITGSITKFGTESSNKSVGGAGIGGGKLGIGNVGKSSGKADVAINLRVIDTSTGEVVAVAKGEGVSKRGGFSVGGGGAGGGKLGAGGINFGASDFKNTIIGEATDAAVTDTVKKLLEKKDRIK